MQENGMYGKKAVSLSYVWQKAVYQSVSMANSRIFIQLLARSPILVHLQKESYISESMIQSSTILHGYNVYTNPGHKDSKPKGTPTGSIMSSLHLSPVKRRS